MTMQKRKLSLYQFKKTTYIVGIGMACIVLSAFTQKSAFGQATITPLSPQGKLSFSDLSSPDALTFKWTAQGAERFAVEVSSLLSFPRGRNTIRLRGGLTASGKSTTGNGGTYSLIARNRALNKTVRIARANGDIVFWRVVGRKTGESEQVRKWESGRLGESNSHALASALRKDRTVESIPVILMIPDAQIVLSSPEHREAIQDPTSLTFNWRSIVTGRISVLVSADANFPEDKTTIKLKVKSGQSSVSVNGKKLQKIVAMAERNDNTVYWRAVGKDLGTRLEAESAANRLYINLVNELPIANPVSGRDVSIGEPVTVDGNASSDPDGDPLIYEWTLVSIPPGSSVSLSVADPPGPAFATFTPDVAGDYVVQLVVDDGKQSSTPAFITITTNELPIADPGSDKSVSIGDPVMLDGSASFDPDGDPLIYEWTLVSAPPGSSASLSVTDPPGPAFSTFTPDVAGDYVVQLVVDDGKRSSAPAFVTITAELQLIAADAGPDQLNVRFGVAIQLDGSSSQPSSGGGALTYLWEQILGSPVDLIGAETATPSFTTPTVNELQYSEDKERWRVAYTAPKDTEFAFMLTIGDEKGGFDSDEVVVSMTEFPTSGLQNVGVGTKVLLNGATQPTYEWTLTVPGGSAAALFDGDTRNPGFVPDVVGTYTITEANSSQSIIINAAKWVGVGGVGGASAHFPQCAACHDGGLQPDRVTGWQGTGHATFFKRAIDGAFPGYEARCVRCHTVGYDSSEPALNDGFDDAADTTGWQLPSVLEQGNFDNMPDLPKKLTNIQCENCHGPGSVHSGQTSAKQIDVSFNVGVCAQCHDEPDEFAEPGLARGRQLTQWKNSVHSKLVAPAANRDECAGCHTAQGFVQRLRGGDVLAPENPEPQSCAACHDPHSAANQHQLRSFGDATLPNGEVVSAGAAAICHECHNSRVDASDPATRIAKLAPHHATQAEMLAGANAQEYGQVLEDSFHTIGVSGKCVTCHQSETPSLGKPGRDLLGEHTWAMRWDPGTPTDLSDDIENVAVCQGCHGPSLTTFDRPARGDYDGNGQTDGIQTEITGLLTILQDAINESLGGGVTPGSFSTDGEEIQFFDANNSPVEPLDSQFFAAYNYFFVLSDGSFGIHNAAYAVQLLQKSYRDLTGSDVSGAVIR